jgi:hypothetical protein
MERVQDAEVSPTDVEPVRKDSMVTVRLSEPPRLSVTTEHLQGGLPTLPIDLLKRDLAGRPISGPGNDRRATLRGSGKVNKEMPAVMSIAEELDERPEGAGSRRGSDSTDSSGHETVNWEELERTEEQTPRDKESEDVSNSSRGVKCC